MNYYIIQLTKKSKICVRELYKINNNLVYKSVTTSLDSAYNNDDIIFYLDYSLKYYNFLNKNIAIDIYNFWK